MNNEVVRLLEQKQNNNIKYTDISDNARKLILKWYDGNFYSKDEEKIEKALEILTWCFYEVSDIDYRPPQMREEIFCSSAERFKISKKRLIKLFLTYKEVIYPQNLKKTKIIAFEGIDGSGKTVQINGIKKFLEEAGYKVGLLSFPVYDSFFGKKLGFFLSGNDKVTANSIDPKSMSLWYALDRYKAFEDFDLEKYDFVLLNRHTLSNAVYQSVRYKDNPEELISWVFDLEHSELRLPIPDIYFLFDINPTLSRENVICKGHRNYVGDKLDVYEKSESLLELARRRYLEIANQITNSVIINCINENHKMKPFDEIQEEIIRMLKKEWNI